ncbi:zinc-binding dehydrogenase [Vibrio nigripulchritudo]|uniref:zinc-binding dehydrogenase n=1 Tax=Vibrio nigripulchritudo TaxID=28173 RepID=UPI0003B208E7|nr:zinc-binding dehydrogenase [Vibrio nigripulchritudo]CCN73757.1 putative Threonine dehydrogenase and related Zn-dependent dehydrogenase [Vibrio nigripulchritudo SFn118]
MNKEIVFTAPNTAELWEFELPPLGETEIRGRTVCSLISPGTETAWFTQGEYPLKPGYAAVFEAQELGRKVSSIKPGQLVLCMGGHRSAQQFDEKYVVPLPEGMSASTGVIARLMGVSMTTLMTTKARPGDKVIVSGAGPVGYLAAHQCKLAGYDVLVIDPNPQRREEAIKSGLNALPSFPLEDLDYAKKVALVIDCSGHEAAILDACRIVRKNGEVVLVGVPWKANTDMLAHAILNEVFFNYVNLRSGWEWEVPLLSRDFVWEELYEGYNNAPYSTFDGFKRALKWLSLDGVIPLNDLTQDLKMDDPQAIYSDLVSGKLTKSFNVLNW